MLGWCTCELLSECSCTSRPTSRSALTTLCPSPPPRYALLFSLLQHSCVSLNLSPSVFRLLFSRATHAARARVLFFMLLFATSPRPTDACRFSLSFFFVIFIFFFYAAHRGNSRRPCILRPRRRNPARARALTIASSADSARAPRSTAVSAPEACRAVSPFCFASFLLTLFLAATRRRCLRVVVNFPSLASYILGLPATLRTAESPKRVSSNHAVAVSFIAPDRLLLLRGLLFCRARPMFARFRRKRSPLAAAAPTVCAFSGAVDRAIIGPSPFAYI